VVEHQTTVFEIAGSNPAAIQQQEKMAMKKTFLKTF
jgi:hypothetical protein